MTEPSLSVFEPHRVVELLQAWDGEEVVNVDPVLNQQLHKVHPVQHQRVHHGLLQGVHLSDTNTAIILLITSLSSSSPQSQ